MRKFKLAETVIADRYPMQLVRHFRWGAAYQSEGPNRFALILAVKEDQTHIVYEYDDLLEYIADLRRLEAFPGGGDGAAGAGAPAPLLPPSPVRVAGEALALPREEEQA